MIFSPLVGVLTAPGTVISLVGDSTNHREINNDKPARTSAGTSLFNSWKVQQQCRAVRRDEKQLPVK